MNRIVFDKSEMVHLGGSIWNAPVKANKIIIVFDEQGKELKSAYNILTETLTIVDFGKKWNSINIVYEPNT